MMDLKTAPRSEEIAQVMTYLDQVSQECLGDGSVNTRSESEDVLDLTKGDEAEFRALNPPKSPFVKGGLNTLPLRWDEFTNPFELKLWNDGDLYFKFLSRGGPVNHALHKAADSLCSRLKSKPLPDETKPQIQLTLAHGFQALTPSRYKRTRRYLGRRYGDWGLMVEEFNGVQWWYPSRYLEDNLKMKKLFAKVCLWSDGPEDCLEKLKGKLRTFEVFDFLQKKGTTEYVTLSRLAPVVPVGDVTPDKVRKHLGLMRDWYLNNMHPDGRMTYLYLTSRGRESLTRNNMIRQFMTTLALFRLGNYLSDPPLLAAAEKNLAFNLNTYMKVEEEKKIAYIQFRGKAKLGSAAFALLSVLESKIHPDKEKLTEYFLNFILGQRTEDGAYRTFYVPKGRNDNQNFYPGEAQFALMTLYESNPEKYEHLLPKVEQSFHYYRNQFHKRPNPAFVPWHTLALSRLYRARPNPEIAKFIFEANDFLIAIQNTPKTRFNPDPDTLGRFYDPAKRRYGPPHASSTAIYVEGLVDALGVAVKLTDTERIKKYTESIRWGVRSLFQLQFTEIAAFYVPDQKAVLGALHTTVVNNDSRVDNTQHATMAFLNLLNDRVAANEVFNTGP